MRLSQSPWMSLNFSILIHRASGYRNAPLGSFGETAQRCGAVATLQSIHLWLPTPRSGSSKPPITPAAEVQGPLLASKHTCAKVCIRAYTIVFSFILKCRFERQMRCSEALHPATAFADVGIIITIGIHFSLLPTPPEIVIISTLPSM